MDRRAVGAQAGVVLVTGAASGIGRAVAQRLAVPGARLGLLDCDQAGLAETAADARSAGAQPIELVSDVSDDGELARCVERLEHDGTAITATVACAGIWTPGSVESVSPESWERGFAVNVRGVFLAARHAIPAIKRAGGGAFVAIASDAGLRGFQSCAAYVSAKHAVVGLIRALALDHGPDGIRSNAICPGFVETPMLEEIFARARPAARDDRKKQVPLGRFATPTDVAGLVAFLLSEEGAYVNGEALLLDGGAGAGQF